MGTRSLTVFVDTNVDEAKNKITEEEVAVMYRQFDGYPTGMGADLKRFIGDMVLVNGLGGNDKQRVANGIGCLAAQVVAEMKTSPGGVYLYPCGSRDCGEEYIYTLRHGTKRVGGGRNIRLTVQSGAVTFFGLPGTKQSNMGVIYDGDIRKFNPKAAEKRSKTVRENAPNDFLIAEAARVKKTPKLAFKVSAVTTLKK